MAKDRQTATKPGPDAAGRPGSGPSSPPRSTRDLALDWLKSIAAAVLLFLILRTFLVQTFVITSSSMEDTLLVGDFLILNKVAYGALVPFTDLRLPGYRELERGDIVVFRPPHDPDLDVVKRIVGMEGDTLRMEAKALFVNGQPAVEPYVRHSDPEGDVAHRWMRWQCGERVALGADISGAYRVPVGGGEEGECGPSRDSWGPLVVPEGGLFMMGDNRDDSVDSRYWGFLDADRVRGKASIIYYSYDAERLRPFAFIRNIRPARIGNGIR
ncbi:MAG TPA: signal peptidase I [Longimicrobiales bacterium]|nr:signal peptidase I [Longimicrobiales bacterium]